MKPHHLAYAAIVFCLVVAFSPAIIFAIKERRERKARELLHAQNNAALAGYYRRNREVMMIDAPPPPWYGRSAIQQATIAQVVAEHLDTESRFDPSYKFVDPVDHFAFGTAVAASERHKEEGRRKNRQSSYALERAAARREQVHRDIADQRPEWVTAPLFTPNINSIPDLSPTISTPDFTGGGGAFDGGGASGSFD
ncbi:MAG: hypothetical protein ACXWHZ_15775 [Usitatibacter sp.]